jgi:tetratricopeptide (TPR) repeat protein
MLIPSLEQALLDFTKTIELGPASPLAYYTRGAVYVNSGNPEQAILDFNKVIELDPTYTPAYHGLGSAYANSGNLEQALYYFEQYLSLAPNTAEREKVAGIIQDLKTKL